MFRLRISEFGRSEFAPGVTASGVVSVIQSAHGEFAHGDEIRIDIPHRTSATQICNPDLQLAPRSRVGFSLRRSGDSCVEADDACAALAPHCAPRAGQRHRADILL